MKPEFSLEFNSNMFNFLPIICVMIVAEENNEDKPVATVLHAGWGNIVLQWVWMQKKS